MATAERMMTISDDYRPRKSESQELDVSQDGRPSDVQGSGPVAKTDRARQGAQENERLDSRGGLSLSRSKSESGAM